MTLQYWEIHPDVDRFLLLLVCIMVCLLNRFLNPIQTFCFYSVSCGFFVLHDVLRLESNLSSILSFRKHYLTEDSRCDCSLFPLSVIFHALTLNPSPIRTANKSACIPSEKKISPCQCMIWFRNSNRVEDCPFCIWISLRFVDGFKVGLQFISVTELACQSISKVLRNTSSSSLFRTG